MSVNPRTVPDRGKEILRLSTLSNVPMATLMSSPDFARLIALKVPDLTDDPEQLEELLEAALQWQERQGQPRRWGNMAISDMEKAIWVGRLILTPNGAPGASDFLKLKVRIESQCDDMPGVHASRYTENLSNYWKAFVKELDSYLRDHHSPESVGGGRQRKRSLTESNQILLPLETHLFGLSGQLLQAIGQLAGTRAEAEQPSSHETVAPESMYVPRLIQPGIIDRLGQEHGTSTVELVIGEAGHGKSTLLWGLYHDLKAQPHAIPILVSAAWLRPTPGHGALVSGDDLQRVTAGLQARGNRVVVLLDTADLLLHNERARLELVELVKALQSAGVAIAMTSRPAEALFLPPGLGHVSRLGEYDTVEELPRALQALTAAFCKDRNRDNIVLSLVKAVARGLPVATVCQSPLMLRMLFELSAPEKPSTEIDVTALYSRYWARRVKQDKGPGRDIDHAGADLSPAVGCIALAMLAGGSPEIRDDELPEPIWSGTSMCSSGDAIDILIRRGVLLRSGAYLRFFHQTMFEFAAAEALGRKDPVAVLDTLLQRMNDRPADLFTGAVLEQTLILFGRQRIKRAVVAGAVGALLGSDQESLQSIGIVAWAHHPWLPPPSDEVFATLPTEIARSFVRIVPRVTDVAMADVGSHFVAIWHRRETGLCQDLLEAMERLGERFPGAVAECFATMDCPNFYLSHHRSGLDNPVLIRLVKSFASTDAALTRSALLRILEGLGKNAGRTTFLKILDFIQAMWGIIGEPAFARELVTVVVRVQAKKSTNTRSVREALGKVLLSDFMSQETGLEKRVREQRWLERCDRYCTDLENDPSATLSGAQLSTLGFLAITLPADSQLLAEILNRVLSIEGKQSLRQLPTNFLAIILSTPAPAAQLLIPAMVKWLGYLPVVPNKLSTQEELWASIARATITDTRVSPENLKAICDSATSTDRRTLWMGADWLVSVLPAAVLAGVVAAKDTLNEVTAAPTALTPQAATIFLDRAVDHLPCNPELVDAFAAIALTTRASGALRRALTHADDLTARESVATDLARFAERLIVLGESLLDGHGGNQSAGAELLRELQLRHVINLEWEGLEVLLERVTHPEARAVLIRLIPLVTPDSDIELCSMGIGYIQTQATLRDGKLISARDGGKRLPSSVANAIRDTWIALLGKSADPSNLHDALVLCLLPLEGTKNAVDTVGFPALTQLLTETTTRQTLRDAVNVLLAASMALLQEGYSDKQQRNASNVIARALAPILETDSTTATPVLLSQLNSMPVTLATFVVRTVCQVGYIRHRRLLESLLDADIQPKVKTDVVRELRRRGDPNGSNMFPEILDVLCR